jgi:hypothetical protein
MHKFGFVFEFTSDSEDSEQINVRTVCFTIGAKNREEALRLRDLAYGEDPDLDDFIRKSEEKYGIHDVCCGDPMAIGYSSYEIEDLDTQTQVIHDIRNWFRFAGYELGNVLDMHHTSGSDFDPIEKFASENLSEEDIALTEELYWSFNYG